MCKHRNEVFDCWDSLKTTPGSSHPKYKYSEYSILKPLLPGLEGGKAILVLHIWERRKEGRNKGRKKRKVFSMLPGSPEFLASVV